MHNTEDTDIYAEYPERSVWEYRFEKLLERLERYREWFTDQPQRHLVTTMVLGTAVALATFLAWKLLALMITGLVGWFTADTPPAPPEPATPHGNPVPAALLAGAIALAGSIWWVLAGFVTRLFR